MKKITVLITLVLALQFCFVDGLSANSASMDRRQKFYERMGGFVEKPVDVNAPHVVITDNRKITDNSVDNLIKWIGSVLQFSTKTGEAREKDISIVLVDEGDFAIYPDKSKAIVTPGKDEKETEDRLMTALVHILGVEQGKFGPQIMGTMLNQAKALDIPFARRTTYKQAVKEGWAPAPTNDIQRAVWDSVKNPAMTNTPAK